MEGPAAKRHKTGDPREGEDAQGQAEEGKKGFEAFATAKEFVKSQGVDFQNALKLSTGADDHAALFAKLQNPDKNIQQKGRKDIVAYKAACNNAVRALDEMKVEGDERIAQTKAALEQKRMALEALTAKTECIDALRKKVQESHFILKIGQTPVMLLLEFSVGDNAPLRLVNSYLDPYSLFQWGKFVAGVEPGPKEMTVNEEAETDGLAHRQLSAAHEIGLSILNHTTVPNHGLVPCDDLREMFLDVDETLEEEEELKAMQFSQRNMRFQSRNWALKHVWVGLVVCRNDRDSDMERRHFRACLEDLATFTCYQLELIRWFVGGLACLSTVLAEHYRQFLIEGVGCGVVMETMRSAARLMNIHFSAPLETQYVFPTIKSGSSLLQALMGKLTLRDIVCLQNSFHFDDNGFLRPDDSRRSNYREVRNCSHEELIGHVEKAISSLLEAQEQEAITEDDSTRPYLTVEFPSTTNHMSFEKQDEVWEDWVVRAKQLEKPEELEDVARDVKECAGELRSFVRDELHQLGEFQAKPELHSKHEPFSLALQSTPFLLPRIATLSAEDLALLVVEDFALGVALRPIRVRHQEGGPPFYCHLIIGKLHGTTMAAFGPCDDNYWWEYDSPEGASEDDTGSESSGWDSSSEDEDQISSQAGTKVESVSFCAAFQGQVYML